MKLSLSRINTILLIAIIVVNGYVAVMPLLPAISFWWQGRSGEKKQQLTQVLHSPVLGTSPAASIPEGNRLVIPAMLLDVPFYEGQSARTLTNGPWLRPQGTTPDKGGNTVIAAHRFTYTNPQAEFYHLDKLRPGDEIGVFWKGAKYLYRVREVKVVSANAAGIEAPTGAPRLTLYTCTPLLMPKDRLAVIAELTENY